MSVGSNRRAWPFISAGEVPVNTLATVRVIAIVCTGLAAGVFLGHRMGVSLAMPELGPTSFVQLQQIIHVHFARMMPILMIGAAGAALIWAILLRGHWRAIEFWLVSGASLAMTCVLVLTLAINVPINGQLMTWNIATPPANLMELWRPWEKVHSIRTVLTIAAFVSEVVALSAFARSARRLHVADYGIQRERHSSETRS